MTYKAVINEKGQTVCYKDVDTGETISAKEYEKRQQLGAMLPQQHYGGQLQAGGYPMAGGSPMYQAGAIDPATGHPMPMQQMPMQQMPMQQMPMMQGQGMPPMQQGMMQGGAGADPLIQPGATILSGGGSQVPGLPQAPGGGHQMGAYQGQTTLDSTQGRPPTAGQMKQGKNLRLEGIPHAHPQMHGAGAQHGPKKSHGFLDATSIAILLPTLVLLALIIAAAHKKRLFPWQTIRTFNPPSGMLTPRDYERSFLCPPNLRRHGRMGKRNPEATWEEVDGVVIPFGFLARTHLPITIPMGRLPNKNMFIVAPSGSGKTTLMRAIIKSLLAKPCVVIALEAKANDPNLDEKKEGFKYTVLPEAQQAGFDTLYFNPLDTDSVHWNPLDLPPNTFASSIVQDVNSLDAEEQHWAERDMGYIEGLAQLLKWGAVQVIGEDENGQASELEQLPCNPRGLMKLVNNRRNIVESLRQAKNRPEVNGTELSEMTQRLSSIIRTDADWDKNIQGVRGRLRMFKNPGVLAVTEYSNIDLKAAMNRPTVLIFGAPASLGPDAESLAACFVYQMQQALHTRYGTKSVLPLFAFFDEYQTLNIDVAGRLSAIVRGANGGLTLILQNISQITSGGKNAEAEMRTIFSNCAIRVCLHNADEQTAAFFSEEIGKHAIIVPGIADHYQSTGFGIFPSSWNRIHSQQVVARVDSDTIKRMEKQHALVYLAPAGDPEFGETKPFMVDLRGIEEIARLHLLHNVSVRRGDGPGHAAPIPGAPSPNAVPTFMSVPNAADAINNVFHEGPNGQHAPQNGMHQHQPQEPVAPTPSSVGNQLAQVVTTGVQSVIGSLLGKAPEQTNMQQQPQAFAQVPHGAGDFANAGRMMSETAGAFAAGAVAAQQGMAPNAAPGFAQGYGNDQLANLQAASRAAAQAMGPTTDPYGYAGGNGNIGNGYNAGQSFDPNHSGGFPQQPYGQIETAVTGSVVEPMQAAPSAPAGSERDCPHCGKHAGKGKFCIECGKKIDIVAAAPAAAQSAMPSLNASLAAPQQQANHEDTIQAVQQQVVGPMGARKETGRPQPRYGGLEVTSRENLPSKRPSMAEAAQQMGAANPYAQAQAQAPAQAPVDPRMAYGTGGNPNAGPLSQRVAAEAVGAGQNNPYHRSTVTSMNPDVAKFGFNPAHSKKQGVEF
ncbi:type IV secretory system conjugative DNA transfer family protein [Candidatus Obscuribacterales bacterium]|nr:type IV secretory system conjugative DNA transfer family protein [Candidatus Obscuribacterales bacterium]